MEKILIEKEYDIPSVVNRVVQLGINTWDKYSPVYVKIVSPSGFNETLEAFKARNGLAVAVHKRINGKILHPITKVTLRVFQIVEDKETVPKEEEYKPLNPITPPPEEKTNILEKISTFGARPKDWKAHAIEKAQKRKERLARIKNEVNESNALKPAYLNGKKILTADDVDYSRGMALIENLKKIESKHNEQSNIDSLNQKKLLCEFYDIMSFSGIGVVIGLYLALGNKVKGKGDLNFLSNWYRNELSKVFSPTSLGEIAKKGKQFVNSLKPSKFRSSPNPGFSIKQAEKIIGDLFCNEHTGEPYRMKDLECEVYQPVFFDDEQSRVYSSAETPNAKIVDVVLFTGLDPLYFQSKKVENFGLSMGPTRRSFDLPIAQHNDNIVLVSIGTELTYQETEENFEGMNPAQVGFLNKKKTYRLDWLDAEKYMKDHPGKVNYLRIFSGQLYGVMANSISKKDLDACVKSAERTKWWSNASKPAIEWS